MTEQIKRETVGRTYSRVRYGLHSRKVGTDGWYGSDTYKTQAEAQVAIDSLGSRYQDVGGITVDFGPAENLFEYRIVKVESVVTVLHTELKKL